MIVAANKYCRYARGGSRLCQVSSKADSGTLYTGLILSSFGFKAIGKETRFCSLYLCEHLVTNRFQIVPSLICIDSDTN